MYIWGTSSLGEFLTPHHIKLIAGEVSKVSIGTNFGVAIAKNGLLYSWGENNNGQLGTDDLKSRTSPEVIK